MQIVRFIGRYAIYADSLAPRDKGLQEKNSIQIPGITINALPEVKKTTKLK
jgi:hypothetical protein